MKIKAKKIVGQKLAAFGELNSFWLYAPNLIVIHFQLMCFPRVCSKTGDFENKNKWLTAFKITVNLNFVRERSDSVVHVECLTRDRGAAGSSLTGVTALCP